MHSSHHPFNTTLVNVITMRQRSLIPVFAAGSLFIGALIYSTRPEAPKSDPERRRDAKEAKRAEGLSGAGVGGNFTTGGHELSSKTDREPEAATVPKEKLPSGGVGGGVGAGGANVRAIEMKPYDVAGTSSSRAGVSGALHGLFSTTGTKEELSREPDTKNTKVASHYEYTPTKRGNETAQHDMRQPRVPRENTPGGYDNKDAGPNV